MEAVARGVARLGWARCCGASAPADDCVGAHRVCGRAERRTRLLAGASAGRSTSHDSDAGAGSGTATSTAVSGIDPDNGGPATAYYAVTGVGGAIRGAATRWHGAGLCGVGTLGRSIARADHSDHESAEPGA